MSRTGEGVAVEMAEVRGLRQRLVLSLRSAATRLERMQDSAPLDWRSEVKAELALLEQAQRLLMQPTGRAR